MSGNSQEGAESGAMLTSMLDLLHGFEPLAFYLATIAVFLVSALRRPEIGLYYLAFFLPLVNVRYMLHAFPYGEKFADFVLLGVFIGIVSRRAGTEWTATPLTAFLSVWGVMLYASLWRGSFYLGSDWPISTCGSARFGLEELCRILFLFSGGGVGNTHQEANCRSPDNHGCVLSDGESRVLRDHEWP